MDEIYYSKEHEWIRIQGEIGTIGITDYAAHQLGDITFVELPKIDKEFKQFDIICTIESVKAASDIYIPMSGKVIDVNTSLESEPEIINKEPEDEGWLVKILIKDKKEIKELMGEHTYQEYIKEL